jgi:hypothetical protein
MNADMTQFTAREARTLLASLQILQKKGLTVTCPDRTPITDMQHILKQRLSAHQPRERINGNVVSITSGKPTKTLYTIGTEDLTVARYQMPDTAQARRRAAHRRRASDARPRSGSADGNTGKLFTSSQLPITSSGPRRASKRESVNQDSPAADVRFTITVE